MARDRSFGAQTVFLPASPVRLAAGLALAVALPAASVWLDRVLQLQRFPTVLFLVAIVAATYVGRLIAGIVASVCSTLLVGYYFVPPKGRFVHWGEPSFAGLITFAAIALVTALVFAHERSARAVSEELRSRAEDGQRRFDALAEASRTLALSLDIDVTLTRATELAVAHLGDWACLYTPDGAGALRGVSIAGRTEELSRAAEQLIELHRPAIADRQSAITRAFRSGRRELLSPVTEGDLSVFDSTPELVDAARRLAPRSAVFFPLRIGAKTLGVLGIVDTQNERAWSDQDLRFGEEMSRRMARAIENARLYRERDEIATVLQQSLLPGTPTTIPGLELAARYQAAGEAYEVGGDFYDVVQMHDGSWLLVVGDVCGKGPKAAAVMGMTRGSVRAACQTTTEPKDVLEAVNGALLSQQQERFCTVAAVCVRRKGDVVEAAAVVAGHPRPVLTRRDGSTSLVGEHGTLLGVFPEIELHDARFVLETGDALVMYTDGLEGTKDSAEDLVLRAATRGGSEGADELVQRLEGLRRDSPRLDQDDLALLAMRVLPAPKAAETTPEPAPVG